MGKVYQGMISAKNMKLAVVVGRFNEFITGKLLDGALDALRRHEVEDNNLDIVWVPGAFEIPLAARKLTEKDYDAVICLGAVIRGATPHFDYVASEVSKGIAQVGLKSGKPVIFGVITADSIEQAIERAGTKVGNKGWDAAMSAMEMVNLMKEL